MTKMQTCKQEILGILNPPFCSAVCPNSSIMGGAGPAWHQVVYELFLISDDLNIQWIELEQK